MKNKSGREMFERNEFVIFLIIKILKFLPKSILIFFWNCTTNHSQIIFIGLRYVILKSLIMSCGKNVKIGTNVQILSWENLSIGSNVSVHSNCYLDASGGITIGNDVSIAHNSSILSTNHDWSDYTVPIKYNKLKYRKVEISDDVWIGCGCRVLSGVVIGKRSIVAAGSVVNKIVNSNIIVGGVPAKEIK